MKKIFIFLLIGIFLTLPLVSALDAELPQCYGLDEQLIICDFDAKVNTGSELVEEPTLNIFEVIMSLFH